MKFSLVINKILSYKIYIAYNMHMNIYIYYMGIGIICEFRYPWKFLVIELNYMYEQA